MKIQKGDMVKVISGKDAGKEAEQNPQGGGPVSRGAVERAAGALAIAWSCSFGLLAGFLL